MLGFFIGFIIGGFLGVAVMALARVASDADQTEQDFFGEAEL